MANRNRDPETANTTPLPVDVANLTLDDVLNPSATFEPKVVKATRKLAKTKPWKGTFAKRLADFREWAKTVAAAYRLGEVKVIHDGDKTGCSGGSEISVDGRTITLRGRLSVVTLMHLLAKARQVIKTGSPNHFKAIVWSVNLFKRRFPLSYGRCRFVGGLLVNDGRRDG